MIVLSWLSLSQTTKDSKIASRNGMSSGSTTIPPLRVRENNLALCVSTAGSALPSDSAGTSCRTFQHVTIHANHTEKGTCLEGTAPFLFPYVYLSIRRRQHPLTAYRF